MIAMLPVRGYFDVNCYFMIDDHPRHGFIIDPGAEAGRIINTLRSKGWIIDSILLTHGHFDHMGAAHELRTAFKTAIYAHENAGRILTDPYLNLSSLCGPPITLEGVRLLYDGQKIISESAPDISLEVIHTPGHTPDSVTFYSSRFSTAFVGDTIFRGTLGTWEYPSGNRNELLNSIREKIFTLPPETTLLSGHSDMTSVQKEINNYI